MSGEQVEATKKRRGCCQPLSAIKINERTHYANLSPDFSRIQSAGHNRQDKETRWRRITLTGLDEYAFGVRLSNPRFHGIEFFRLAHENNGTLIYFYIDLLDFAGPTHTAALRCWIECTTRCIFLTLVAVLLHVHREIERVSRQEKSTLFSDIGPRGVASAALMAPIVTVTGWMIASLAVFAVSSVISPDVAVRAAIASVFVCFPIAMTKSRKIRGALLVMAVSYGAFFVGVISGNWW